MAIRGLSAASLLQVIVWKKCPNQSVANPQPFHGYIQFLLFFLPTGASFLLNRLSVGTD